MSKGTLIVLSGPSGVGKTTICNAILKKRPDIRYSVSATSRPRRKGEKEGREYLFLTEKEFKTWIDNGQFIEYAEVHGNLYGTPKKALQDLINNGHRVLLDVDVKGAKKLMRLYPDGVYFFIMPPDFEELRKRLVRRNTDKNEVIQHRLARAREEAKYKNDYKYVIENRKIKKTIAKILSIIEREIEFNEHTC